MESDWVACGRQADLLREPTYDEVNLATAFEVEDRNFEKTYGYSFHDVEGGEAFSPIEHGLILPSKCPSAPCCEARGQVSFDDYLPLRGIATLELEYYDPDVQKDTAKMLCRLAEAFEASSSVADVEAALCRETLSVRFKTAGQNHVLLDSGFMTECRSLAKSAEPRSRQFKS